MTTIRKFLLTAACLAALAANAQTSPYAGEQARDIKSLSEREAADLAAGQGMGFAKAAELNGYPGPAHVLEHAEALALTAQQRGATQALMTGHKARARALGQELLAAERALEVERYSVLRGYVSAGAEPRTVTQPAHQHKHH